MIMILVHTVDVRLKKLCHRIGFQCTPVLIVIQNIVKTMDRHALIVILLIMVNTIKYMRDNI